MLAQSDRLKLHISPRLTRERWDLQHFAFCFLGFFLLFLMSLQAHLFLQLRQAQGGLSSSQHQTPSHQLLCPLRAAEQAALCPPDTNKTDVIHLHVCFPMQFHLYYYVCGFLYCRTGEKDASP